MKYRELNKFQAIFALLMEICQNPRRTPGEMMKTLGIDKYKYYRYFKELNLCISEFYGGEIEYQRDKKCYRFTDYGNNAVKALLNPHDFYLNLLLTRARNAAGDKSGKNNQTNIADLKKKNDGGFDISRFLVFFNRDNPDESLINNLYEVHNAILSHRVIRFNYKSKDGMISDIVVKPLRLVYDRWWYLHGIAVRSDSPRNYKVIRMSSLSVLPEKFRMPPVKDINISRISQTWDFDNKKPTKVKIEIKGLWSRIIEEEKIHPTQKTRKLSEGKIEVEFVVSSPQKMVPWILSFGGNAKVVEPQFLMDMVIGEARKVIGIYKSPGE